MCYSLYISTDSSEDLSIYNTELVRFEKLSDANNSQCTLHLDFPNKWYVGSRDGCSCAFRHLYIGSVELGFSEPVDWFEEDLDDIQATQELYVILKNLLTSGYHVDLVDPWYLANPEEIITFDVCLDEISEKAFRLFENHKFILRKSLNNNKPSEN